MNRLKIVTRMAVLTVAIATLLPAAPVRGQIIGSGSGLPKTAAALTARLTVTPYAGMYNPIGKLRADSTVELLQLMTLMVGTRVSVPLSQRFAVEGTVGWTPAPSWVAQSDWQQTVDVDGKVALASLRARYQLNAARAAGDWVLAVGSGVGLVHRYGPAWEGMDGTTDAALVLNAGWRFQGLGSRLSYGVDVEGFVSRAEFTDYLGQRTASRLHADLVSSFSLILSF